MGKIVILWILFLIIVLYIGYYVHKYRNFYKLIMVFGKKGSGKSTLICKLAYKQLKRNIYQPKKARYIYSSIPIDAESMIEDLTYYRGLKGLRKNLSEKLSFITPPPAPAPHGTDKRKGWFSLSPDFYKIFVIDPKAIGEFTPPPESLCLFDEVGMLWDNRDFKNFKTKTRDWFKLQRHYHCEVYLFSQTFDVDVKLRNLTDYMFMVTNYLNVFSVAHRIQRKLVVVEPTGESEGRIADGYEVTPLIWQLLGMRIVYITWVPKWSQYFNSFETPELPLIPATDSIEFFSK